MSSYIVDREHIQYLLAAMHSPKIFRNTEALRWFYAGEHRQLRIHDRDHTAAIRVAQTLWDANRRGVAARYKDSETLPGPMNETFEITTKDFGLWEKKIDPVQVLKSIRCLQCQSCHSDDWGQSEAKQILNSLFDACIEALPGYEEAIWGAPER